MKKVLILIAAAIIVVLLVYKLSLNNKFDTTDWNTYTNKTIGYELSYPSGYEIVGDGLSINKPTSDGYDPVNFISIVSAENPDLSFRRGARSLDDYRKDYMTDAGDGGSLTVLINDNFDVNFGNSMALKQVYSLGYWEVNNQGEKIFKTSDEIAENHFFRYVFFDGNDRFVILKIVNPGAPVLNSDNYNREDGEEHEKHLDGVASTFSFTK